MQKPLFMAIRLSQWIKRLVCATVLSTSAATWADESCSADDGSCVEVGSWIVSLAVGLGERTNPIVDGDDIPMVLLPTVQYYGKRFFWDSDTVGFTMLETERHMLNAIGTVSYDQMYFRDVSIGNFSFGGGLSGSASGTIARFGGSSENFVTPTPVATATPTPTIAPTLTPTPTVTVQATPTPEFPTPQASPTPVPTSTPDPVVDVGTTPTPTPVSTPTPVATSTPDNPSDDLNAPPPDGVEIRFDNLHERRTSGLMGLEYTYNTSSLSLGLQVLQEVTRYHHGHQVRGAFTYFITGNKYAIALGAGAEWKDEKTLDYYFGIRPEETNTGWSYSPGEGTFSYVKVDWRYRLSRHWDLQATVQHRMFPEGVKDSPLLSEDSSTAYFVGGVYRF